MIRRVLGRARRASAARLVPLRASAHHLRGLVSTMVTIATAIIARAVSSTLARILDRDRLVIAVDINPYYEPLTGIGWYEHHLLTRWARRDQVRLLGVGQPMLTDGGPRFAAELPEGVEPLRFDLRGRTASRWSGALCRVFYPALIRAAAPDVHFAPNYFFPRIHRAVATPSVLAVHDLTFRRHPELLHEATLENLERNLPSALLHADAVVCVSHSTRQDLLDAYPISPGRVHAVHSGLGSPPTAGDAPRLEEIPRPYALFVSTIEPRKNVAMILEAVERLWREERWSGHLVLAGRTGWKAAALLLRIEASPWRNRIHRLEYVDPQMLSALYRDAQMFLFPSLYEGFGFPLLEAMAHGTPAITSNVSSLPEIGGEAALYVNPEEPSQLADAIERLAGNAELRRQLGEAGRRQAAGFDWDTAAARTLEILYSAAGRAR